ncbi:MAG: hypothetical protein HFH58_01255 [Lachnospiraceae bacterium]|jgi:hypothetical protein|nr:hypothetical protein [Lachnospiraceae bacterium]
MERWVSSLLWIGKVGVASLLAIVILSLFSYGYSYSGVHIASETGVTDYKWEANQRKAAMTEGFAWIRMDRNGYNNTYTEVDKVNVLLMGSSHMEAVNVASDKNTGYLLNKLLPGYTYNIGISGHTIYNCINNLQNAVTEYSPNWIVIETDRVKLECDKMKDVVDGNFPHIKSYDSGVLYYIQKYVPGVKLIYNQLSNWINMENDDNESIMREDISENYVEILDEFLSTAASTMTNSQKLLIVYQPKTAIDESGKYLSTSEDRYSEIFRQRCKSIGIEFVDLSEEFEALYTTEHVLAHGFSNTAAGEGHLNETGHKIFAEQVEAVVRRQK